MKFSHKIAKLGQPLTYQRAWRRAERIIHPVPLEPLPDLGRKFDLITAFSIDFNRISKQEWWWGPEQWAFFLDDLSHHLNPGGRVFLALNPGGPKKEFYTPELLDFFLSRGASVE